MVLFAMGVVRISVGVTSGWRLWTTRGIRDVSCVR